jgi:dTDP-glucose 4,6-dehydratase
MTTILVTGGAGFIGSNFIIYFLKKYPHYKILNLDKLTYAGNLENLKEVEENQNYVFIHGDICDKGNVESIFQNNDIDFIVNFAAESHVDNSILDPELFIRANVLGTANLLSIAKKYWETKEGFNIRKKFLQISTDEVYGSLGDTGLFTEITPLNPHSPYSASKASADMIVKSYFDTFNMPINITRCSNNYGPYQFPEKLIPLMINNALAKKHLPVYGDGLNIRDWLFVEDHIRAIDLVLHNGSTGEVYNIGGNNERTNIEIIRTIIGFLNRNVDDSITETLIKYVQDRKGHDKRYGIDAGKIRRDLGWYPVTPFEEGLVKVVKWYVDNKKWVENIASRNFNNI